jgi:heme/copper-type cytochrome/quinol oxidase subunit 3
MEDGNLLMDTTNTTFVQSTPNPAATALAAMVIRDVLLILSGFGVTFATHFLASATYSDTISVLASAVVDLISVLVALGTIVWGWIERHQTSNNAHKAAVESAKRSAIQSMNHGKPIEVVVAPVK